VKIRHVGLSIPYPRVTAKPTPSALHGDLLPASDASNPLCLLTTCRNHATGFATQPKDIRYRKNEC
jgi:hypothetical protein